MAETLPIICAWCAPKKPAPGMVVSHGICAPCKVRVEAALPDCDVVAPGVVLVREGNPEFAEYGEC